jgi:hypothetical protein
MLFFKKLNITFLIILFLFNSCTVLPGVVKSPKKKSPNTKIETNEYSIEDVKINIIKINSLSDKKLINTIKISIMISMMELKIIPKFMIIDMNIF